MKALVFHGINQIDLEDRDEPDDPKETEVIVRTAYCGICGSDLTALRTGNYVPNTVIGHECSGRVVRVGNKVTKVRLGDRVVCSSIVPCGSCSYCLNGRPELCENAMMIGISVDGGMADLVKVPEKAIFTIPEGLDLLTASLAEPLAIVLHSINIASSPLGKTVLVQGAGPIGLLEELALNHAGASKIMITDISSRRLSLAKDLLPSVDIVNPISDNVFSYIERITNGNGVDLIFDTTGSSKAIESDFTLVKRGGKIIIVGIPEEISGADFFTTVLNEISIYGSYEGYNEMPTALTLLSNPEIPWRKIITSVLTIDSAVRDGFMKLLREPAEGKVSVSLGGDI
ncbi:alcohol dehydrogenase catalytic domain-containing protein [Thermoplasma sp.]|uniref:zinc-dependent alcohol dehydrogenase n=1 Tax=Thermoplasma sp. TaxID=1973142 RepID=UPI0026321AC3|nr:alcohol dehydrogenase catalytic domain-containing protein [Thermoplasma sp.]